MVAGGNDAAETSIYDPETNAWTAEGHMQIPRGYQSVSRISRDSPLALPGTISSLRFDPRIDMLTQ